MTKTRPQFRWQTDWKSIVFVVLMLPVLISLGFWQLNRAEEKREILALQAALIDSPAIDAAVLDKPPIHQPVYVRGEYVKNIWLLDNRIQQGKFGYEIIQRFNIEGGSSVLVSRGWIQGDKSRRSLPEITTPEGVVTIEGSVYYPTAGFSLGAPVAQEGWPKVVQWLEIETIRSSEGEEIKPWLFWLAPNEVGAESVERSISNQPPEKHIGYAVQWFAMSVALVIIFILRNTNILSVLRNGEE